MTSANHNFRLAAASLLAMVLGSYLFVSHAEAAGLRDVTRINNSIEVEANDQVGDVSSINGRVQIERNAVAGEVDTINGGISLHSGARVQSAETVNGAISVDENVTIARQLHTVNGGIRCRAGSTIGGSVETVNGRIDLRSTEVGGDVETANGDISLSRGSTVRGDVIIRGKSGWLGRLFSFGQRTAPQLEVDADSVILGDIHLYRETHLQIHPDAEVGNIYHHY